MQAVSFAHIVKREEFEEVTACLSAAKREMVAREAEADARFAAREADLQAREADLAARIEEVERLGYANTLRQKQAEANAEAAVRIIDEVGRIRAEFEALTPWLTELVGTAMRRIAADLAPSDLIATIVAAAVAERAEQDRLMLRIATEDQTAMAALLAEHPERFAAISKLQPDAKLAPGAMILEGQGGFTDIGVEAQIDAVLTRIEDVPKPDEVAP